MKINNIIKILLFKRIDDIGEVIAKNMNFAYAWIGSKNGCKFLLGHKMNFGIFYLIFQATNHGRCENNIANGTKSDNQDFDLHL